MRSLYKLDAPWRQLVQRRMALLGYDTFADLASQTDVGYTGLTDTAEAFTGRTTFDGMIVGSGVPLGKEFAQGQGPIQLRAHDYALGSERDPATYGVATRDFIDGDGPGTYPDQSALGAWTDPGFYHQDTTPTATASIPDQIVADAFGALSKFGNVVASLFGNHPQTVASAGNEQGSPGGAAVKPVASGTQTAILAIVVIALALLLLRGGD